MCSSFCRTSIYSTTLFRNRPIELQNEDDIGCLKVLGFIVIIVLIYKYIKRPRENSLFYGLWNEYRFLLFVISSQYLCPGGSYLYGNVKASLPDGNIVLSSCFDL